MVVRTSAARNTTKALLLQFSAERQCIPSGCITQSSWHITIFVGQESSLAQGGVESYLSIDWIFQDHPKRRISVAGHNESDL